eukprot:CAMPEP_0197665336 /NCGR_PEP_ID=MMETSP1338-20131121/59165_1 /TAXON_ID=43686 ORGANISM="Pelagodinium beii, Strain RCC1491" /NCGR_SAMPLE_ID=MMETSP1338 /ASSEMBLY_ACC=CAM_ASM_000754 /LENGTH=196 /DNA_ID=CAMNT_0043244119 /DNA_START=177 /DNA_END=767 /DNA_ORIENTATION=+
MALEMDYDSSLAQQEQEVKRPMVDCKTTKGRLRIVLATDRSPIGTRRFMDLVRDGFMKKQALFRTVKGFLSQFGISGNREMNEKWSPTILDDEKVDDGQEEFHKGTLSFAGNGLNSRNSQLFITLADLSERMGKNPWERPIGQVLQEDLGVLDQLYAGYGEAVEQQEFVEHGDAFIKEFFPRLDYIESCELLQNES